MMDRLTEKRALETSWWVFLLLNTENHNSRFVFFLKVEIGVFSIEKLKLSMTVTPLVLLHRIYVYYRRLGTTREGACRSKETKKEHRFFLKCTSLVMTGRHRVSILNYYKWQIPVENNLRLIDLNAELTDSFVKCTALVMTGHPRVSILNYYIWQVPVTNYLRLVDLNAELEEHL